MYRLLHIVLVALMLSLSVHGEGLSQPQRTPEEVARKQTAMLCRHLGLRDSIQKDTLYRMHLKYARMRQISPERNTERRDQMDAELRGILTPEQYESFMTYVRTNPAPRQPNSNIRYHGPKAPQQ